MVVLIRKPFVAGVRAVAIVEAAKAALVLLAGLGVLTLIHRDVQAFAERLVRHSHLNPASKYPRIFLQAAEHVTDTHLWFVAGLALLYALVRGIEAYGLWFGRRWAEWFALASGAIYLPVEIYEIFRHVNGLKISILLINAAIVAYMAYALCHPAAATQPDPEPNATPPPTG